jgi:TonB-linked SusC/RagA family outer membrane protein
MQSMHVNVSPIAGDLSYSVIYLYYLFQTNNGLFMRIPTPHGSNLIRVLLYVFVFNLLGSQHVLAAYRQDGKQKITIVANDIPLEKVMKQIEKQTGMRFMYAEGAFDVNEKVSPNFKQTTLDEVLASLLGSKGMLWQYSDGSILLKQGGKKTNDNRAGSNSVEEKTREVIFGTVTDNNGIPVPGVTILVKGTQHGTKTAADGSFSLKDVDQGQILLITSIGFETKEIVVNQSDRLLIRLKVAVGALDEAVVIAYGTASARTLTGNVSTIKAADIEKSPVSNPLQALSGRVAGLNINQKSGFTGAGMVTMIQGQNSILKGNDPFYVIDGVPYPSQGLSTAGDNLGESGVNTIAKGSTMSYINPNDIESISVLKDADATAIYGSRAANGAILITTKKGKPGRTKITIDYQQGVGKVTRMLKLMNTKQYMEMRHEAIANDGGTVSDADYDINGFWDTTRNTNFQKEYFGKNAQYMNVNGTISGGSSNMQYLIGGTYHKETNVLPGNFTDQKGAVHFTLNANSNNNKFRVQFSGNYMIDNNRLPLTDLTPYAVVTPPTAPKLYNPDGSLNFAPDASGAITFYNPLVELNRKFNTKTKNLVSNLLLNYEIAKGLNLRTSLGYTDMRSDELITLPLNSNAPDQIANGVDRIGLYGDYNIASWIVEPQISYNVSVGEGKLEALAGSSIQRSDANGTQLKGTGYNTDNAINDINSADKITANGATQYVYRYAGVFGRLNYILQDKYVVNLSVRRDGSSRFGSANRFHNFAAVGIGWIFSQENFVKDNLRFLSYGKLRFSFGTTGNDQVGDYQYLSLYNPVYAAVPYRGIQGLIATGLSNPYLQWEETKKTNFGLDLGILKDKVILNANYYINRSSNQLLFYALPSVTGFTSILTNYPATVQNTGLELTLNGTIINKNQFRWTAYANATIPRNKLIEFKNIATSSFSYLYVVGQPISITKVFHYAGVDPQTGVYQFMDSKGGITTNPDYSADRQTIVNTGPNWYGGIGSNFSYGNVSLDVLFQYMNRKGINYFGGGISPAGSYGQNEPTFFLDRWRKAGDNAGHALFSANYSQSGNRGTLTYSDAIYGDASYCRLKNVAVTWQLPERWMKHAHIANAKVYAQGQNLLTFTNYKGMDPETLSSTTLPPLRTFVFGLQLTF